MAVHPSVLSGAPFIIATALVSTLEKKFGVSAIEGEGGKRFILLCNDMLCYVMF